MHSFLREEEKSYLWRLEEENKQVLQRLRDNAATLGQKSHELETCILELEQRCQASAQKMLKVRGLEGPALVQGEWGGSPAPGRPAHPSAHAQCCFLVLWVSICKAAPRARGCLCVHQIQPSGWARWAAWLEGTMRPPLPAAACPLSTELVAPGGTARWNGGSGDLPALGTAGPSSDCGAFPPPQGRRGQCRPLEQDTSVPTNRVGAAPCDITPRGLGARPVGLCGSTWGPVLEIPKAS